MPQPQEITLQELQGAKISVAGRLSRLRTARREYHMSKSPIAKIDVFAGDIVDIERIYKEMQQRLDNAKITIEI